MNLYVAILLAAFLGVVAGHRGMHEKCAANLTITVDECCKIPAIFDRAIVDKCRKQFPIKHDHGTDDKQAHEQAHKASACMARCILSETGAFKNDKLDTTVFKQIVKKAITSPSWADPAIDQCIQSATTDTGFLKDAPSADDSLPKCNIVPKLLVGCVYSTLFQTCSTTDWNDRSECRVLKDKIKNGCPYFALRGRPRD